jgi:hypothetical protein
MVDPVVTADGHSFERRAIGDWFGRGHVKSPMTGAPLEHTALAPNHALRSAISEYMEELQRGNALSTAGANASNAPPPQKDQPAAVEKLERECVSLAQKCAAVEAQRRALEADLLFLERRFTERAQESAAVRNYPGSDNLRQRSGRVNGISGSGGGGGGMLSQVRLTNGFVYIASHSSCFGQAFMTTIALRIGAGR